MLSKQDQDIGRSVPDPILSRLLWPQGVGMLNTFASDTRVIQQAIDLVTC